MFTGIVSDIGTIVAAERRGDLRLRIASAYDPATIDLGASIACSGVCLTVVDIAAGGFAVDVSAETEARSAAGMWAEGNRLNLERALKLGDELGGHIVTGHVDGVAEVLDVRPEGDSRSIGLRIGAALAPFLAAKGSVTLDGVSLTVNDVADGDDGTDFSVNLIPHTQAVTTFGQITAGRHVNVEIDVLARYLRRMQAYRVDTAGPTS